MLSLKILLESLAFAEASSCDQPETNQNYIQCEEGTRVLN